MFKIPTFRLKIQPSSGESDKNLHRERTYNEEKCKFLVNLVFVLKSEIQIFMRQGHAIVPLNRDDFYNP